MRQYIFRLTLETENMCGLFLCILERPERQTLQIGLGHFGEARKRNILPRVCTFESKEDREVFWEKKSPSTFHPSLNHFRLTPETKSICGLYLWVLERPRKTDILC